MTWPEFQASEKSFDAHLADLDPAGQQAGEKTLTFTFFGCVGFDLDAASVSGRRGVRIGEGGVEFFDPDRFHAPDAVPEGVQVEAGADLFGGQLGERAGRAAGGVEGVGVDLGVFQWKGWKCPSACSAAEVFAVEEAQKSSLRRKPFTQTRRPNHVATRATSNTGSASNRNGCRERARGAGGTGRGMGGKRRRGRWRQAAAAD